MPISELATQLKSALDKIERTSKALEDAQAALAPLEAAAETAKEEFNALMREYQKETGGAVTAATGSGDGRRRKRGPQKARTPEQNVQIQMKKARTQGTGQGLKGAKLEKFVEDAGKKAAEKAGIPFKVVEA